MKNDNNNDDDDHKKQEEQLARLKAKLENLKNADPDFDHEISVNKNSKILSMLRNRPPNRAAEYMKKLRNGEVDPVEFGKNYRDHPFYEIGYQAGKDSAEQRAEMYIEDLFEHIESFLNLLRQR